MKTKEQKEHPFNWIKRVHMHIYNMMEHANIIWFWHLYATTTRNLNPNQKFMRI